jgi:hypothetical protein
MPMSDGEVMHSNGSVRNERNKLTPMLIVVSTAAMSFTVD